MESLSPRPEENNTCIDQTSVALLISVSLMCLIDIATILGNVLIIISILKATKIRNRVNNRFILSLASSDLLLGVLVLPLAISKLLNHFKWPHGVELCKAWCTFDVVFCSASIYNLIGISLERFYAVYCPLSYTSTRSGTMVNLLIAFAWMMALAISGPMYVDKPPFGNWNSTLYSQSNLENMDCGLPIDENSQGWIWYSTILAFIIPTLLIVVINSLILKKMQTRQSKRVEKAQESVNLAHKTSVDIRESQLTLDVNEMEKKKVITFAVENKNDLRCSNIITVTEGRLKAELAAQTRITTMMSVVIGAFLLCWAPFTVMFVLTANSSVARQWFNLHPVVVELITWTGYLNAFVNPIIYTIMNMEIRNSVKGIFIDINKMFSDIKEYFNICCKLER